jgi:hypothetical protein
MGSVTKTGIYSLYNALLYGVTPEYFPATFRGSASGALSTLGRIAGIVSDISESRRLSELMNFSDRAACDATCVSRFKFAFGAVFRRESRLLASVCQLISEQAGGAWLSALAVGK